MAKAHFNVEKRKAPIVVLSIFAGVTGGIAVLSLVLILVLAVTLKLLVIPVIFAVICFVLVMTLIDNVKTDKRYKLCVTKGHKGEARIIGKFENTMRNAKGYPGEPSWEKTWDTVTVEYKAEDGNTYSSTFGMDKAGEIGDTVPVLQYDKYAVFDLTSMEMFRSEKNANVCTCGYKLTGREFICPSCGKTLK